MSITKQNHQFIATLIILLAFFIVIFVTKNVYYSLEVVQDTQTAYTQELQTKKDELSKLNTLQNELNGSNSEKQKEVSKFLVEYNQTDIINYLYKSTEAMNSGSGVISIKSVNFEAPRLNEYGLEEANITLGARISNTETLLKYLDFLTGNTGKYRFYIDNFSFPNTTTPGAVNVTIPLKLFYKS